MPDPTIEVEEIQPEAPGSEPMLQALAEELGTGHEVYLRRLSPSWCAGFLDSFPLDPSLSLRDIRDTWGGNKLEVGIRDEHGIWRKRIRVTIDAPPRRFGRVIEPGEEFSAAPRPAPAPAPAPAASPPPPDRTWEMFNMMIAQQDRMLKTFAEVMTKASAPIPVTVPVPTPNPLDTLKQAGETIAMVRDMAADLGGEQTGDKLQEKLLGEVVEKLLSRRDRPATPAAGPSQKPRFIVQKVAVPVPAPATGERLNNPPPIQTGPDPAPPAADPGPAPEPPAPVPPVRPVDDPEEEDLDPLSIEEAAEMLAEMDTDHAALAVRGLFESLPAEKQRRAIDILVGNAKPDLDNSATSGASSAGGNSDPRKAG